MEKIVVDCQSINDFGKMIKEESDNLVSILDSMKDDSILYENMIDSKVGNLYKEVMIQQLQKEKDIITKNGEELSNKFVWISNTYKEAVEDIKESIGG